MDEVSFNLMKSAAGNCVISVPAVLFHEFIANHDTDAEISRGICAH